jgi:hypothetical protein
VERRYSTQNKNLISSVSDWRFQLLGAQNKTFISLLLERSLFHRFAQSPRSFPTVARYCTRGMDAVIRLGSRAPRNETSEPIRTPQKIELPNCQRKEPCTHGNGDKMDPIDPNREPWCCSPMDDLMLYGTEKSAGDNNPSPRSVLYIPRNTEPPQDGRPIGEDNNALEQAPIFVTATDFPPSTSSRTGTPVMEYLLGEQERCVTAAAASAPSPALPKRPGPRSTVRRKKYKISTCESWTSTNTQQEPKSCTASCNASQNRSSAMDSCRSRDCGSSVRHGHLLRW